MLPRHRNSRLASLAGGVDDADARGGMVRGGRATRIERKRDTGGRVWCVKNEPSHIRPPKKNSRGRHPRPAPVSPPPSRVPPTGARRLWTRGRCRPPTPRVHVFPVTAAHQIAPPLTMAASNRDWMFCPVTGALLDLDAARGVAWSPASSFERPLADLADVVIVSETDMDAYRRRHRLQPLAEAAAGAKPGAGSGAPARSTVDEPCVKCGERPLEFYTMQLRSADEGSTVFYECLNEACGHKWNQNN